MFINSVNLSRPLRQAARYAVLCSTLVITSVSHANTAENFTLADYRSPEKRYSLSDFEGKVVYLDFWATWCKPCRASFPWMNEMQAKYEAQGFEVVSINLDQEPLSIATFLNRYPANFKILLDPIGEVASDYELLGMPSSYLIDKDGVLRHTHTGFFNKSKPQYEQEIVSLLSE